MPTDRFLQLQAMLAEEPGDKFLRYAIALEHKRSGHMEQAAEAMKALIDEDPKYIPPYYQLALLLGELGRVEEAVAACEAGSLQSLAMGDLKARGELLALKEELQDA